MSNLQQTFVLLKEQELQELAAKFAQEGIDVRHRVLTGAGFIEIIKQVLNNAHDLVIKPAGERGGLSSMLFGSTDMHLLRKCPWTSGAFLRAANTLSMTVIRSSRISFARSSNRVV